MSNRRGRKSIPLTRVISGGQTGADRGALDAALAAGFPIGGWCPAGRKAEDGTIPERYPLQEIAGDSYADRTLRNVESADGTVIFFDSEPAGGTELTLTQSIRRQKPYQLIDVKNVDVESAVELVAEFVTSTRISVLNVAGPRDSECPVVYQYVHDAMSLLLQSEKGEAIHELRD